MRGRYRVLFFALLGAGAYATNHPVAVLPAGLGLVIGLLSIGVATRRPQQLAHSFAVADWLLLGCALALAGGVDSWLLGAVTLLAAGQLGVSPQHDRPYLLAATPLLLIVLAIADPSLGGNQATSVVVLLMLLAGGVIAAYRLSPDRSRRARPARIDSVSGFLTAERLPGMAAVRLDVAHADDQPLSLVYLRLQDVEVGRGRLSRRHYEALIRNVAACLESQLGENDLAFSLPPNAFVLLLPGRSLSEARESASKAAHEVAADLTAGRRQTLAAGAASFPAASTFDELLTAARDEARPTATDKAPAPQAARLAAAQ